jgi:hypothetical protein
MIFLLSIGVTLAAYLVIFRLRERRLQRFVDHMARTIRGHKLLKSSYAESKTFS